MGELGAVLDSALLFRRQRGALPQTFIFFVTSRCNARCDFCLYYAQITSPVAKASELTPEEADRIAARYGPLHYLALSGGEPFVRSDVAALCEPFIARCGTSVVDIPSSFYFGERMLEAVESLSARHPGVVIDLQLSLDHVGEAHDASRKVPGLYARARESFAALAALRSRRSNVKLKINLVYLRAQRGRPPPHRRARDPRVRRRPHPAHVSAPDAPGRRRRERAPAGGRVREAAARRVGDSILHDASRICTRSACAASSPSTIASCAGPSRERGRPAPTARPGGTWSSSTRRATCSAASRCGSRSGTCASTTTTWGASSAARPTPASASGGSERRGATARGRAR
ncbi:MAG: radical SAM protein [Sandaracinaceae bacterium]|nr:radical SAM protein [Sandaracinaceae bacterium]